MLAKCSAWPASWKSARQSSAPPIGWMTSMTLPGTSIGAAERARRLLRPLLDVEVDVLLRSRGRCPRSCSVATSAGSILSAGKPSSHCGDAEDALRRPSARPRRGRPRALARSTLVRSRLRRATPSSRGTRGTARPGRRACSRTARRARRSVERRARARRACVDLDARRGRAGSGAPRSARPGCAVEPLALRPRSALVRDRRAQHPERDLLAVDRHLRARPRASATFSACSRVSSPR